MKGSTCVMKGSTCKVVMMAGVGVTGGLTTGEV